VRETKRHRKGKLQGEGTYTDRKSERDCMSLDVAGGMGLRIDVRRDDTC